MSQLLSIFAVSPLKPVQYHTTKIYHIARLLVEIVDLSCQQQWLQLEKKLSDMQMLQEEANEVKHYVCMQKEAELFPFEKSMIVTFLQQQANMVAGMLDIARTIIQRNMKFPPLLATNFQGLVNASLYAITKMDVLISKLEKESETLYLREASKIKLEMQQIVRDVLHIKAELTQDLQAIEALVGAIEVIFLYHLIEKTTHIAGQAEQMVQRIHF